MVRPKEAIFSVALWAFTWVVSIAHDSRELAHLGLKHEFLASMTFSLLVELEFSVTVFDKFNRQALSQYLCLDCFNDPVGLIALLTAITAVLECDAPRIDLYPWHRFGVGVIRLPFTMSPS